MLSPRVAQYMAQVGTSSFLEAKQAPRNDDEALRQVSKEFESIFLQQLLKEMRQTTLKSGLFGNDRASQTFEEMHDEALAGSLAGTGSLGIGRMIYEQLKGH